MSFITYREMLVALSSTMVHIERSIQNTSLQTKYLDSSLARQLATTDEFICQLISLQGLQVGIHGVGNNLSLLWQKKQLLDRVVDYNITVNPRVLLDWELYIQKGRVLACAMDATEQDAAQFLPANVPINSQWVQYSDLTTWGWSSVEGKHNSDSLLVELDDDLKNIDTSPSNNLLVEITHNETRYVDGHIYEASGGFYHSFYNVKDGAIIVTNVDSPEQKSGYSLPFYPRCGRWSDVTFLQWQKMAGQNIGNLRHVFHTTVTNDETLEVMEGVLGEEPEWYFYDEYNGLANGLSFYPGGDDFNSLLYTPNVRGLAWLLIQHKPQLGHKRISKITLFGKRSAEVAYAAIYLEIESVS